MKLGGLTMPVSAIKLHRRARDVFYQLDPDQQGRVEEKLKALAGLPPSRWPGARDFSTPNSYPDYLVPVDDSLRFIIQAKEGQPPEVIDIVMQERLDAFAKLAEQSAK
jgi:hypothetical protein